MPDFILDFGSPRGAKVFSALDCFTRGYVEAMFFTSEGDELGCITFAELAPEALTKIIQDCERFQTNHAALLDRAYTLGDAQQCYDDTRAGRDYWYTRNGHGTGFWDRGLGDVGAALADAARYSEVNLYRGDDGKLYL